MFLDGIFYDICMVILFKYEINKMVYFMIFVY